MGLSCCQADQSASQKLSETSNGLWFVGLMKCLSMDVKNEGDRESGGTRCKQSITVTTLLAFISFY